LKKICCCQKLATQLEYPNHKQTYRAISYPPTTFLSTNGFKITILKVALL
jgi:hypothetical protein